MDIACESSTDTFDGDTSADKIPCPSFNPTLSADTPGFVPTDMLSDPFHEESDMERTARRPSDPKISSEVLGQFSFAPATQTTVVTTTTTTTTRFPPLMMKTATHLHELDPKQYPLAASPTPTSIKSLCFDIGGRPTVFREADNTSEALQKIWRQQKELQDSHGILRTVAKYPTSTTPEGRSRSLRDATPSHMSQNSGLNNQDYNWSSTTPVSISEAANIAHSQTLARRAVDRHEVSKKTEPLRQGALSRLQICQTATPITPNPAVQSSNEAESRSDEDVTDLAMQRTGIDSGSQRNEHRQPLSPRPENGRDLPFISDRYAVNNLDASNGISQSHDLGATLPRIADPRPAVPSTFGLNPPIVTSSRPRPSALDTTAAQDMSLPSPSLSPVTAAANLQHRRGYFEDTSTARNATQSALSSPPQEYPDDESFARAHRLAAGSWAGSTSQDHALSASRLPATRVSSKSSPAPSMMQIPDMLDSFEAMPAEMKSYVIYQLLRRCPKPVLHFVANVVDPALKCDFLNLLPFELCQNVVGHLDVKSLCRAGQVSKKWRQVIDSDEKTWKNLFDFEGFMLPADELQQAIWEGWGWQFGSAPHDFERNIGDAEQLWDNGSRHLLRVNVERASSVVSSSESQKLTGQSKRSKRKAASKWKLTSRKQQKRKESSSCGEAQFDCEALLKHVSGADGPYAAAQAATIAVPVSQIGLPDLRILHLYKSLYRRHHLISANWMQNEIKPRHLAFKAHGRHVVTCLQFDTDKILTGSDDNNINVYDTQTGALRARLVGHEGGVWALHYQGNTLVSGSTDRSVRVWDIEKGTCEHVFSGHTSTVRCLIILMPTEVGKSSSGKAIIMPKDPLIITGSRDSNLRVWRLPKPEEPSFKQSQSQDDTECPYFIRALTGHVHSVRAIAAHADTLVSGSYDCTVRVWKISTGETVHRLTGHTQKVYSVVLDHERNRCISGSMDNLVKIWSLATGRVLYNLEGHSSLVGLLDLQRNRLVSAAADSTLRIWDPETGHCKSTLSAHTGAITCFQHDGRKVISGSDRTLKMWDVKTGEFVRDLLTDLSGVWQVKFDERRCVAAVQRNQQTYLEVLDFGASRDGVPERQRGKRTVVDLEGIEVNDIRDSTMDLDAGTDD